MFIKSDYYLAFGMPKSLKTDTIWRRRKKFFIKTAFLIIDMKRMAKWNELIFSLLSHTTLSPDLTPHECFLSWNINRMCIPKKFNDNGVVIADPGADFEENINDTRKMVSKSCKLLVIGVSSSMVIRLIIKWCKMMRSFPAFWHLWNVV